jgi:hypothetical protein
LIRSDTTAPVHAGKYLEAALAGWRVVRLGPNELTAAHIGRLVALVAAGWL